MNTPWETPTTDQELKRLYGCVDYSVHRVVSASFARTLERRFRLEKAKHAAKTTLLQLAMSRISKLKKALARRKGSAA